MAYEWRCADCGMAWPEDGHARYFLAAGQHMKRQGHTPLGLVDTETGEVLVPTLNRMAAERLGIIATPDRRRKWRRETPAQPIETGPDGPAAPPRHDPPRSAPATPIGADPLMSGTVKTTAHVVESLPPRGQVGGTQATILTGQVQWPTWTLAFFDILREDYVDAEGQPYAWSSRDFIRFVLDIYRYTCRHLVRQKMRRRMQMVNALEREQAIAAALATLENMDQGQFLSLLADRVADRDPEWANQLRATAEGLRTARGA